MSESGGLSQRISSMEEKLDALIPKPKSKKKKFKLKYNIRIQAKNAAMKDRVLVFYLKSNRYAEAKIAKMKNGMIELEGKFYDASMSFFYIWRMGKSHIPCLFIPQWSLTPIGTKDYEDAVEQKKISTPQQIIIRAIEMKENLMTEGKKMSGKVWIFIIIGLVAAGYIFFGT